MNKLAEFLEMKGFHESGCAGDFFAGSHKTLINGNLEITIATHQSEILFSLTRKCGYTTSIIELLATHGFVSEAMRLIIEDWPPVDINDSYRINEYRVVNVLAQNWDKIKIILVSEYHRS